jgi:protein-tyrosine phosphatase
LAWSEARVIDLHSHVLPGIDDGAADLDEALAICRAAAADGIEVLAGTPHVRSDHETTADSMEAALSALREAAGDLIRLVPGGELDLGELDRPPEELARFGLGGNPAYLLVETPYVGWPLELGERLFRLRAAGVTPVLAHPERNAEVQARPQLLEPVVAGGTLVQLTAASIDGRQGLRAKQCAATLLDGRLAHLIASDAHTPRIREIGMAAAARELRDEALARWLTTGVPGAIVAGTEIPPRPERPRRWPRSRAR